jgi:hypothetical protein
MTQQVKKFTIDQVFQIFNIKGQLLTLTNYKYKGENYVFQFNFEAEKKGERIMNIIKTNVDGVIGRNNIVGQFEY